MQRLEVSGAVRPVYGSLGVRQLNIIGFPTHICYVYSDATQNVKINCRNQSSSGYTIHILPAISNQLVSANLPTQCAVPSCSCCVCLLHPLVNFIV